MVTVVGKNMISGLRFCCQMMPSKYDTVTNMTFTQSSPTRTPKAYRFGYSVPQHWSYGCVKPRGVRHLRSKSLKILESFPNEILL